MSNKQKTGLESAIVCPEQQIPIWTPKYGKDGNVSRVQSDFEELGVLGVGAFGTVVQVRCMIDHQIYAVKKISLGYDHGYQKATREVIAMARLSHSNVVRYHTSWLEERWAGSGSEAGETGVPMICIQMELCFGTLEEHMRRGLLTNDEDIWRVFKQLVKAVNHCHLLGIRHGDLSPHNIFMTKSGDIKVGDFGYTTTEPEGVFQENEHEPSTVYSAPEMVAKLNMEDFKSPLFTEKIRTYSLKTDIFSLGLILLEMFAKLPDRATRTTVLSEFMEKGTSPASINPTTMQLVRELTNSSPDLRPKSTEIIRMLGDMHGRETGVAEH